MLRRQCQLAGLLGNSDALGAFEQDALQDEPDEHDAQIARHGYRAGLGA